MLTSIAKVYRKEIRDILRDRRTFRRLLISVLFMPVILNVAVTLSQRSMQRDRDAILPYSIVGAEYLPALAEQFASESSFREVALTDDEDVQQAVEQEKIKFALIIPENAQSRLASGGQVDLDFYFYDSSTNNILKQRVSRRISGFSDQLRDNRLATLGIASAEAQQQLLQPIKTVEHNSASRREMIGNAIGGFVPYMLFLMCLTGCTFVALDLGAGEKERGTLETLLLLPVSRQALVWGKFLTVFTAGVVYATLSITSVIIWLNFFVSGASGVVGQIINGVATKDLIFVGLMLVPVAAIFGSILLSISVYAKSYKEASSLSSLLQVLMVLPIIIAILPGVELQSYWAVVPITNVALAVKELIKGTLDYTMLLVILGSSALLAVLLLFFCSRWFERETVLFRE